MNHIHYGNTVLYYTLLKKYVNKVKITIDLINGITVTAPSDITEDKLNKILYKKAPWILKKWFEFEEIASSPTPKEFISGEKFQYIGRGYKIKINSSVDSTPTLIFNQGKFIASVPAEMSDVDRRDALRSLLQQWYIAAGQAKINERLKLYSAKLGVTPSKLVIKDQKMRWGTCTDQHAIYINWRVMMAPMRVIDYVLVHELAHIKYSNHSSEYWQFVRSILPDYEDRKDWLRVNGPLLTL